MSKDRSQALLEHLKRFKTHCVAYDNLQGAETLSGAIKRIKELEDVIREAQKYSSYDLYIASIGSLDEYLPSAPEHKIARRIKELENGIRIAIKMLDMHNQFGMWTEGLAKLRGHLKILSVTEEDK